MPIYPQTYRTYDGQPRRRFRWWIIVEQELRLLIRSWPFRILMLLGLVHFLFYFLVVVLYDFSRTNESLFNQANLQFLSRSSMFRVDERLFYMFLNFQSGLVFLAMLYAGSGMICNDYSNNLMEVYFAKPLTWRDYAMGKIIAVFFVGLGFTALPAITLVGLHNGLIATWEEWNLSSWWMGASLGYSLAIVVPGALGILAASALTRSQRYAAIGVFMIVMASSAMAGVLAHMLRDANYFLLSIPICVDRVGQGFFDRRNPFPRVPWENAAFVLTFVSLAALGIILRKVRRAEVA